MSRFDVPDELKVNPYRVKVSATFDGIIERADNNRSVTPGPAKNYFEFCQLVKKALDDYQERIDSPNKASLVWEEPDKDTVTPCISISLVRREPGKFDQGAPFEGSVKQLRPVVRESKEDPSSPGYRKVILGKWHDNLVRFTCWAQTNKEAIELSFKFEEMMDKYTWFYRASGVNRVLFWGQEEDKLINNEGKKLYGRPILYFVKTEEISEYSEKELEEVFIDLMVNKP